MYIYMYVVYMLFSLSRDDVISIFFLFCILKAVLEHSLSPDVS